MKKRVLSLLLAVGILLCTGMMPRVFAAEAAGAVAAGSVAAGSAAAGAGTAAAQQPFRVYLSPSPQYYNVYPNGKNEEETMRRIAEQMAVYLNEYGIQTIIAPSSAQVPPQQWSNMLQSRAEEAEKNHCTLYLSLHSNAAHDTEAGQYKGTFIYYQTQYPMSALWAGIVKKNFIYPDKGLIRLANNQDLTEMAAPKMPALLVQTAFHDNVRDVDWLANNTKRIAANLSYSIAEYRRDYYGVPIRTITNPDLQIPFL